MATIQAVGASLYARRVVGGRADVGGKSIRRGSDQIIHCVYISCVRPCNHESYIEMSCNRFLSVGGCRIIRRRQCGPPLGNIGPPLALSKPVESATSIDSHRPLLNPMILYLYAYISRWKPLCLMDSSTKFVVFARHGSAIIRRLKSSMNPLSAHRICNRKPSVLINASSTLKTKNILKKLLSVKCEKIYRRAFAPGGRLLATWPPHALSKSVERATSIDSYRPLLKPMILYLYAYISRWKPLCLMDSSFLPGSTLPLFVI